MDDALMTQEEKDKKRLEEEKLKVRDDIRKHYSASKNRNELEGHYKEALTLLESGMTADDYKKKFKGEQPDWEKIHDLMGVMGGKESQKAYAPFVRNWTETVSDVEIADSNGSGANNVDKAVKRAAVAGSAAEEASVDVLAAVRKWAEDRRKFMAEVEERHPMPSKLHEAFGWITGGVGGQFTGLYDKGGRAAYGRKSEMAIFDAIQANQLAILKAAPKGMPTTEASILGKLRANIRHLDTIPTDKVSDLLRGRTTQERRQEVHRLIKRYTMAKTPSQEDKTLIWGLEHVLSGYAGKMADQLAKLDDELVNSAKKHAYAEEVNIEKWLDGRKIVDKHRRQLLREAFRNSQIDRDEERRKVSIADAKDSRELLVLSYVANAYESGLQVGSKWGEMPEKQLPTKGKWEGLGLGETGFTAAEIRRISGAFDRGTYVRDGLEAKPLAEALRKARIRVDELEGAAKYRVEKENNPTATYESIIATITKGLDPKTEKLKIASLEAGASKARGELGEEGRAVKQARDLRSVEDAKKEVAALAMEGKEVDGKDVSDILGQFADEADKKAITSAFNTAKSTARTASRDEIGKIQMAAVATFGKQKFLKGSGFKMPKWLGPEGQQAAFEEAINSASLVAGMEETKIQAKTDLDAAIKTAEGFAAAGVKATDKDGKLVSLITERQEKVTGKAFSAEDQKRIWNAFKDAEVKFDRLTDEKKQESLLSNLKGMAQMKARTGNEDITIPTTIIAGQQDLVDATFNNHLNQEEALMERAADEAIAATEVRRDVAGEKAAFAAGETYLNPDTGEVDFNSMPPKERAKYFDKDGKPNNLHAFVLAGASGQMAELSAPIQAQIKSNKSNAVKLHNKILDLSGDPPDNNWWKNLSPANRLYETSIGLDEAKELVDALDNYQARYRKPYRDIAALQKKVAAKEALVAAASNSVRVFKAGGRVGRDLLPTAQNNLKQAKQQLHSAKAEARMSKASVQKDVADYDEAAKRQDDMEVFLERHDRTSAAKDIATFEKYVLPEADETEEMFKETYYEDVDSTSGLAPYKRLKDRFRPWLETFYTNVPSGKVDKITINVGTAGQGRSVLYTKIPQPTGKTGFPDPKGRVEDVEKPELNVYDWREYVRNPDYITPAARVIMNRVREKHKAKLYDEVGRLYNPFDYFDPSARTKFGLWKQGVLIEDDGKFYVRRRNRIYKITGVPFGLKKSVVGSKFSDIYGDTFEKQSDGLVKQVDARR